MYDLIHLVLLYERLDKPFGYHTDLDLRVEDAGLAIPLEVRVEAFRLRRLSAT